MVLVCAMAALPAYAQAPATHTVLTTLQATYSITSALAAGTQIHVVNVPAQGAVMESQAFSLTRVDDAVFKEAEAVVGIGRLWRDDPLYPAARARNLRIINIDAVSPWNPVESGVSVIRKPVSDVPWAPREEGADPGLSRFIWLSATNATRMAELISGDLTRLSPADASRIQANLKGFTTSMRQLKADYGSKFATLPDPRVLSLADEFVYLLSDLGIFVDGWFIKQDVNWTDADYAALTSYLKEHGVQVVVHKWEPDAKIAAAIATAGAKLVVLDPGDPGLAARSGALPPEGYQALMRANMDALLTALSPKAAR
jgi:ABC-type Zn uptake system ZnuABC Zn-binding protein ZnuA